MPSVTDIVTLSLLYGRSFESLFRQVMQEARTGLRQRLRSLPKTARDCVATRNRDHSLERLGRRLEEEPEDHGGA